MVALYIIGIVIAFFLLVLFSSVRIKVKIDNDIKVKVGFWFINVTLFPKREKKKSDNKKQKKKADKVKKKPNAISKMIKRKGITETVAFLIDTAKEALAKVNYITSHIHITKMFLVIGVGDEDAALAAIKTGGICAAVYPFLGFVATKTKFPKNDVTIHPVYDGDSYIKLELKARLRVIHAVKSAFGLLGKLIKINMKNNQINVNNIKKDGASK